MPHSFWVRSPTPTRLPLKSAGVSMLGSSVTKMLAVTAMTPMIFLSSAGILSGKEGLNGIPPAHSATVPEP